MSKSKFFLWILLTFWILGSTYWHVFKLKNPDGDAMKSQLTEMDTVLPEKPQKIAEQKKSNARKPSDFSFAKSDDNINVVQLKPHLDSLSRLILARPNKILTITGFYSSEEKNNTAFPNLGLARAFRIKKYFLDNGLPDSLLRFRARVRTDLAIEADSVRGAVEVGIGNRSRAVTSVAQ